MRWFFDLWERTAEETGQTLTEYALLLALIALAAVLGLQGVGGGVAGVFSTMAGLF